MFRDRDTILRMIEQLGDVWRALMDKVDDLEARLVLDDAYQRLAGLDRASAEGLDTDTLLGLLTPDRLAALSELTYFRARRFAKALGEEGVAELSLRALTLLVHVEDEAVAEASAKRVAVLIEGVGAALPPETGARAVAFLALGGAFAQAEDLLFAQLDRWPKDRAPQVLLEAGRAFYQELSGEPAERLAAGNLPREEIAAGEAALSAYTAGEHTDATEGREA